MRGRTFKYSYVILDEAQNTTPEQMKLFLTRIGEGSQLAVNGDPSQSDLRGIPENGLEMAARKLRGVDPKITVCEFYHRDIVRDPIVATVLQHLEAPDPRPSRHSNDRAEVSQFNRA
jgi:phosphate starvation-inducible PhoH-like protein